MFSPREKGTNIKSKWIPNRDISEPIYPLHDIWKEHSISFTCELI